MEKLLEMNNFFKNIIIGLFSVRSNLTRVILTASGLSFIGLGARHPEVEWGLLITQSRAQFLNHWWEVLFPGLFIIFTVISFNVIGDELRKLTNPKELK